VRRDRRGILPDAQRVHDVRARDGRALLVEPRAGRELASQLQFTESVRVRKWTAPLSADEQERAGRRIVEDDDRRREGRATSAPPRETQSVPARVPAAGRRPRSTRAR
jgi:hypothetical protein